MKVWIGYHCHYDGGANQWETVEKIFDDEVKALLWVEDPSFVHDDYDLRKYEEKEVEYWKFMMDGLDLGLTFNVSLIWTCLSLMM